MRILIIGYNTRHIACSAKRAGYTVYSIDMFNDIDLLRCADKKINLASVPPEHLKTCIHEFDADALVLGPGFERFDAGTANPGKLKLLCNNSKKMEEINNKFWLAEKLRTLGIYHPETRLLEDVASGMIEFPIIDFPIIVKPIYGSGGAENFLVRNEQELYRFIEEGQHPFNPERLYKPRDLRISDYLFQEYVQGKPVSVSVISTTGEARAIAVNEQLIGVPWLTRLPFAYCGNITPYETKWESELKRISEELIHELGLVGSNGVDFIIGERGPVVIEVNPRFQGSIDTVESYTGINIFDSHVKAFDGILPEPNNHMRKSRKKKFCGKGIIFSDIKVTINETVSEYLEYRLKNHAAADIPPDRALINKDEPVATLLESGNSREETLNRINESAVYIKDKLLIT